MLAVKNLVKTYNMKGGAAVKALDGVSIDFPEKGMVFVLGKSGSGKSTLLNVAGGLDIPDEGEIIIKGKSSKNFSPADFDGYRNTYVGFVFQEYNILGEFNVEQNIALALQLQGKKHDKKAVEKILEKVELTGMGSRKPNTLSGGQKQRVAIARALVKEPEIIMADEPTGALDSATGKDVLEALKKLSKEKLVIVVSHDRESAEEYGDRIIELRDGKVISDVSKKFRKAVQVSGNVRKIDDKTVELKGDLTEEEFRGVYEMFKSVGGGMILSADKEQVDKFKKVNRITPEGSREYFAETKTEDVRTVQYDGKNANFLKSKMPVKHAVKMGAVSLKARPFRLFLTVLSSILAFSMFGFVSTMALYDANFTVSRALEGTAYDSVVLQKYYQAVHISTSISKYDEYQEQQVRGDCEVKEPIEKSELASLNGHGLSFAGVYGRKGQANDISYSGIRVGNFYQQSALLYFDCNGFWGFCDAGEDYLLDVFGNDSRLAGRYPTDSRELAVSEYMYELIAANGLLDYDETGKPIKVEINSYDDLLGRTLVVDGDDYTVTGIYRTGIIDARYDPLKEMTVSNISSEKDADLLSEFMQVHSYSFHRLAFVADGFYGSFDVEDTPDESGFRGRAWLQYSNMYTSSDYESDYLNFLLPEWMDYYGDYIKVYDMTGQRQDYSVFKDMKKDEIYLPLGEFENRLSYFLNARLKSDHEERYLDSHPAFLEAYARLYYAVVGKPYLNMPLDDYTLSDSDMKELFRALNEDWSVWISGEDSYYNEEGSGQIGDGDKFYYRGGSLKIAGVYSMNYRQNDYIVRRSFIEKNAPQYVMESETFETKYVSSGEGRYAAIISPLKTDGSTLNRVLGFGKHADDDSFFEMSGNGTFDQAKSMGETFAEFLWIYLLAALGMGIVAGLFLFNYISISIMDKQREVGILRALGARGSDVFKIFFSESAILAVICSLLAMVLAIVACVVGNYLFVTSVLAVEIFNFGFMNALILFALAIFIAAVATILPVYLAAKKKPVESIRAL